MQRFVVFAAFLVCAAAAPGLLVAHQPVVAAVHAAPVVPVVASKTTITKSSQLVNHGSPLVHTVHAPVVAAVPIVRTAAVVHAPVVAAPVVHAAPIIAAPVVHTAPVVVKTAPVAIAHSSSIVHHAPVKALPIIAVH